MENASKALIIAGAILISILIIGLGVFIYQKAKGAMDDSINLDSQKIESINSKFEAYEGSGRSASDVKALLDLVRTHNNQYTGAQITVSKSSTEATDANAIATMKTGIASNTTYTITIESFQTTGAYKGFIQKISIK